VFLDGYPAYATDRSGSDLLSAIESAALRYRDVCAERDELTRKLEVMRAALGYSVDEQILLADELAATRATIAKLLAVPDQLSECDRLRPIACYRTAWPKCCAIFREALLSIVDDPVHGQTHGDSAACATANAADELRRKDGERMSDYGEPWSVDKCYDLVDRDQKEVALEHTSSERFRRAATCVNGCCGIESPETTVPELVRLVRQMLGFMTVPPTNFDPTLPPPGKIEILLAKCKMVPE